MWQGAMIDRYRIFLVCLLLASNGLTGAWAAPITGSNQAVPATDAEQAPSPADAAFGGDANATVIEFSVMPSADDPTRMETVVILQRGGGQRICINLKSTDVITRSYRKRGAEPFAPAVPGDIRGLTSGDTGSLIGFNETSVFIRPHTIDDEFTNQNECFIAGEAEGCFLPDGEDCDQRLEEGEVACVLGTISRVGCSLLDHASLSRQMRILVALNQPPGEAPIITAADIAQAPEVIVTPEEPSADLPTGPAPAGPTGEAPPSGSGGGILVLVPDVVGLTQADAEAAIIAADLTVGAVTTETVVSSLGNPFIRTARAAFGQVCLLQFVGFVGIQFPPAFTAVQAQTAVFIVVCEAAAAAIPEPSSLALFATGLGLLILLTWWRRRSP